MLGTPQEQVVAKQLDLILTEKGEGGEMEVRSRAPGKVILCGEHAVVHGSTAVAASINLYTTVTFRPSSIGSNDGLIELELRDTEVLLSWSTERLKRIFHELDYPAPDSPQPCSHDSLKLIGDLYEEQRLPETKSGLASGISAFIYLYTSIYGLKPGRVVVSSDLPMGGGLGSSASFCVSLCGALLAFSGALILPNERNSWIRYEKNHLDLVNKWAFEGEKIIHGKPSGIDNTVSTFGNMIMFRLGELTQMEPKLPLRMLITNTKVGRNTKALVAAVSLKSSRHPSTMASIFSAVDSISKELSSTINSINDITVASKEDQIAELMEINQGLLQCMGVSHSSIEDVIQITSTYKLTSKLTGAGGGGCVLTLLPSSAPDETIDEVIDDLESHGFQCFSTQVGGRGQEIFIPN